MAEMKLPEHARPSVYWYLTFRCNLECRHCWVESGPGQTDDRELSSNDLDRTIDSILTLRPASISLSGGEPLLHRHWTSIIERLTGRGPVLTIETNGTLLTGDRLDPLVAAANGGTKVSFGVSLDGGTAEDHDFLRGQGAFAKTIQGLTRLQDHRFAVYVQCVLNKRNYANAAFMFDLARQMNLEQLVFAFLHPVGRAVDNLGQLELSSEETASALEHILQCVDETGISTAIKLPPALIPPGTFPAFDQLRRKQLVALSTSCSFPMLSVLPDGRVTVCALTRDSDCVQGLNTINDNLVDIWEEHRFGDLRSSYVDADWLEGICGECVFKHGCRGSCRALPFELMGRFSGPHPTCQQLAEEGKFPRVYRRARLA